MPGPLLSVLLSCVECSDGSAARLLHGADEASCPSTIQHTWPHYTGKRTLCKRLFSFFRRGLPVNSGKIGGDTDV